MQHKPSRPDPQRAISNMGDRVMWWSSLAAFFTAMAALWHHGFAISGGWPVVLTAVFLQGLGAFGFFAGRDSGMSRYLLSFALVGLVA
jgi:hypothetical protein